MKLHSIELRNVRGIGHLVIDELPERGVVVIAGDNEMGKSTIAEAIHVALTYKATSGARQVKALRPNDRDAYPEITMDMTLGELRFTLRKVFAGGTKTTATEITVTEPSRKSYTGEDAQKWLDELTREEGTRELWDAFVAKQGTEQAALKLGTFAKVEAALQQASGGTPETDAHKSIVEAALAERAEYYTSNGKEKAPLKQAREAVEDAEARFAAADARVAEVRDLVRQAEQTDARRATVDAELPEAEADVKKWRETVAELTEFRNAKDKADAAARLADVELKNARQAREARDELIAQQKRARAALEGVGEELKPLRADADREAREFEEIEARVTALRGERERTRRVLHLAESDLKHCTDVRRLGETDDILGRVRELDEAVQNARRKLAAHPITADDAKRAADAENEWRMATSVLEASSAEMSITAEEPATVAVDGEDVEVGEDPRISAVTSPTSVKVGGVTVTVTPGDGAGEYAGRATMAKERLDDILSELGVVSVNIADDKAKARAAVEEELKDARRRLDIELQDRDLAEIRELRAQLDADVRAYPAIRADILAGISKAAGDGGGQDGDGDGADDGADAAGIGMPADEQEAQRVLDEARERERTTSADYEAAMQTMQVLSARPARRALHDKQADEHARVEDVRRSVDALAEARDRVRDDELDEALDDAAREFEVARVAAESAAAALDERGAEDADASLRGAETHLEGLREEQSKLRVRRSMLAGELKTVSGVNEERADAESELVRVRRELDSITRRAAAAKLLYEMLEAARAETRRTIGEPLLQKLAQYGGAVFGHATTFELDENMAVKSRSNMTGTFDFDDLSGGAQEQIDVLLRLAVAGVMDGEAGAPVIIDDALGYSDPNRLRKMNNAFARAGEDSQILVLTCYPERFSRIPDSRRLDMADLLRG